MASVANNPRRQEGCIPLEVFTENGEVMNINGHPRLRLLFFIIIIITAITLIVLLNFRALLDFFRFNHIIYLKNAGKYDKAIQEYEKYFASRALSPRQLNYLVELFVLNRSYEQARTLALKLVEADRINLDYRARLALINYLCHLYSEAEKDFAQFLELDKVLGKQEKSLIKSVAETYGLWRRKYWPEIIDKLASSPHLKLTGTATRSEISMPYEPYLVGMLNVFLGAAYINMGLYSQAEAPLRYVLEINPVDPLTYCYLGLAYIGIQDLNRGEYYLAQARTLTPAVLNVIQEFINDEFDSSDTQTALMCLRTGMYAGMPELSLALLDQVSTTVITASYYHQLRGELLRELNKRQEAITEFKKSLHYDNNNLIPRFHLAQLENRDDFTSGLNINLTIVEVEHLTTAGVYERYRDSVGMARNNDYIELELSAPKSKSITLGVVGKSTTRNQVGALAGIYVNNIPLQYIYFPSTYWQLKLVSLRSLPKHNRFRIVFINNYIPHIDDFPEAQAEDRNLFLDKVLIIQ